MFERILVAVEPISAPVIVPQAIAMAKVHSASLLFVHIGSAFDENYAGSFYPGVDTLYPTLHNPVLQNYVEAWTASEARNLDWLKSLVSQAMQAGVSAIYSQRLGDPGSLLCQVAQDEAVDLILVGRRGRSGLSEILLGSVSNHVMHHAPCSVLTVQGVVSQPAEQVVHATAA
ncbi:universal stress protein [filamentous cyanobacterium LEGE 11480]|uniref:Universal stress protein n=1 Tax=Romeriopsis navalis LEGE 11480 TaxID=2777977 RepID=A0A928VPB8_9CYAN|nr:universal stress protein [Romeriopsis navalis]MBE9030401.1 universal stress protein [Romeriopsis navalis LEGE 11480]